VTAGVIDVRRALNYFIVRSRGRRARPPHREPNHERDQISIGGYDFARQDHAGARRIRVLMEDNGFYKSTAALWPKGAPPQNTQ